MKNKAEEIWLAGVEAVASEKLIQNCVQSENGILNIAGQQIKASEINRVVVVGAGKAGAGMAAALEEILAQFIGWNNISGWVNVPDDCVRSLKKIHLHAARPAGVNEPTLEGVEGTNQILKIISSLDKNDLCIVLLSGGGSALLPAPVKGISLDDKQIITQKLSQAGANIQELNTVRKQISRVKGGRLAEATQAGRVISLIISDVIGDPLDIIASGPTFPDHSTPEQAIIILEKYLDEETIPKSIIQYLQGNHHSEQKQNRQSEDSHQRVSNHIIGNNSIALEAASQKAMKLGYHVISQGSDNEGIAKEVGTELAAKSVSLQERNEDQLPICLLSGGEPTVVLSQTVSTGKGGRNQELVLAAMKFLWDQNYTGITILSGGTDGEDGPTDAAGAWMNSETIKRAKELELKVDDYLSVNNSYSFFEQVEGLLITGPTHTNVMDLRVCLIEAE
jgi:glycerate 2-kinase